MKKKALEFKILFAAILVIIFIIFGFKEKKEKSSLSKPTTNDYYNYIAINEIKMWVSNNGEGSSDPNTGGGGFYWPGGENASISAIFTDGLVWGGIVDSIRVNGSVYRGALQAGKILPGGNADDPNLQKYRIYKILKGWENLPHSPVRDQYELDFNEWPVDDGAPWIDVNNDGIFTVGVDSPQYIGDETMWFVSNDLDTSRSLNTYGSLPIGLEFQTTIWGYDSTNFLADVLFKKYRIINKGQNTIDSMYFAHWADDDLGNAGDDFAGCDTNFSLGYIYNGDNNDDGYYGTPPPAVSHMLLQGPVVPGSPGDSAQFGGHWIYGFTNLKMTAFSFYICGGSINYACPSFGYEGALEWYNNMQGLMWDGNPYIDPTTGQEIKYCVPGDPESGTGWYEGSGWPGGFNPGDRYYALSSGPVTMAPGDTQEVVIAIFIAIGTDNINSVTELKNKAVEIHHFYGMEILPEYTISGQVKNINGDGLQATLEFYTDGYPGQGPYHTTMTDTNGNYSVTTLTGNYDIFIYPDLPYNIEVINDTTLGFSPLVIDVILDTAEILLIDDDYISGMSNEDNVESYYVDVLFQLMDNKTFNYYDIALLGFPQMLDSLHFDKLIWFTGSRTDATIADSTLDLIRNYLDDGGKLFMSGQNIITSNQNDSLFSQYVKISLADDSSGSVKVYNLPGDTITGDFSQIQIDGDEGANNQVSQDIINVNSGAEAIFRYGYWPHIANRYAASRTESVEKNYKVVFLAFGFEAITDLIPPLNSSELRANILEKILDWFDQPVTTLGETESVIPLAYDLKQNYPNPFNPQTSIKYSIPKTGKVNLVVYDILGKEVAELVNVTKKAGVYDIVFDGSKYASGLYFYKLQAGDFIQTRKMLLIK